MSKWILASVLVATALPGFAADWPQWRGADWSGVSSERKLPVRWSDTEGLHWQVELPGRGLSSPIVSGNRLYLTACTGVNQDRLHVMCFDVTNGKQLWERQFWATGLTGCHPKTCMAAPTPATDGDRVYALFATNDLVCLEADGTLLWYRSLARDYPNITNQVGMAASPLLWKDRLIMSLETDAESCAIAIDTKTGENRWRVERALGINWVSPIITRRGKTAELLLQSRGDISAYDPDTGAKKWSHHAVGLDQIPSPVSNGESIFVPGGNLTAIRPGADNEPPAVLWQSNKLRAATASPLLYQGRIYAVNSTGVVTCADPDSGEIIWQERIKGTYSASPVAGDDKLYFVNEEGLTTVLDTRSDDRIIATNPLGETILGSPAISGGRIFLRSDKHLFCVGATDSR